MENWEWIMENGKLSVLHFYFSIQKNLLFSRFVLTLPSVEPRYGIHVGTSFSTMAHARAAWGLSLAIEHRFVLVFWPTFTGLELMLKIWKQRLYEIDSVLTRFPEKSLRIPRIITIFAMKLCINRQMAVNNQTTHWFTEKSIICALVHVQMFLRD